MEFGRWTRVKYVMPYHCNFHHLLVLSPRNQLLVALIIYDNTSANSSALQGAVYRGIFASANLTSAVDVTCQTGNCTWPDFASLGACSTCHDVTADSIIVDSGNSVEVPGGLTLTFATQGSEISCDESRCILRGTSMETSLATNITLNRNPRTSRNHTANILTMAVGQLKDGLAPLGLTNQSDWKAFYCSLDLCAKRYSNFTVVCVHSWCLEESVSDL